LNVLSGEVHASTAGVLVDESLYVRSAVLGRLRQASYGGDASMASLSMGGPQAAFADGELDSALAYAKSPIVTKAPLLSSAPSRDIVFWSQGFGAWGKFNGDGDAAAVRRDLAGFVTGFDARFGNWRGGIAAGYTGSRNTTDGRGSANVDTGHVAAYGGWNFGALNLRGGGAYAFHTIDTDRTIAFPGFFDRATAHYQGGTGQIFGEAGYGFAFGKLAVEPFAGAAWVHLDTDAFSEKGGAAALNVAANSFEVGYSTLGVRAASMIPVGDMILVPRASAAWQHAFNDVTPDATVAFQNVAGSFVVAGVPIARDSLLAEAGLDLAINRNATVGVSYTGQIAGNVQDHGAKGKFSWKF
jgi:outer membrane autotransporter protein